MFTGLIEKTGRLARLVPRGNGYTLEIEHEPWQDSLSRGESISVNGVCLTLTESSGSLSQFDVLAETIAKTSLNRKRSGSIMNLERALRASDRMGGHIVTGHIDGIGTLKDIQKTGSDHIITISCDEQIMDGIVKKGSIALDGISLTITEATSSTFSVHIIPTTWESTSFSKSQTGDQVNVETDLIGKYVKKYCVKPREEATRFNPALL